jgi:hypothetical protein
MNTARERLLFYLALTALCLFVAARAHGAQVQSVDSTNSLAQLPNPNTISSNTLVTTEGTIGDGTMAVWTWVKGATNWPSAYLDSLTHPGEGVFVRQPINGGTNTLIFLAATNYFLVGGTNVVIDTVIAGTNVTYTVNTPGGGDTIWTNANGLTLLRPGLGSSVGWGGNLFSWGFTDSDGLVSIHDMSAGDNVLNDLMVIATDNAIAPTNFAYLNVNMASSNQVYAQLKLTALTNWPEPSAPISSFIVDLEPIFGLATATLVNNGATNFFVDSVNGYDGSGTHFLADDGTYKTATGTAQAVTNYFLAAGNGVTVATNVTGTNVTWTASVDQAYAFAWTGSHTYTKNVGAVLAVGATDAIDLTFASATNLVSGAITFLHATNGVDLVDKTHVRWFFNNSGSDQTLTIPAGWRTNVNSAVPPKLTNATVTAMYVKCNGPTSSAALQTNAYVSFEYYK